MTPIKVLFSCGGIDSNNDGGESLFREFWPAAVPTGFSDLRRHVSTHLWSFGSSSSCSAEPYARAVDAEKRQLSVPLKRPLMTVFAAATATTKSSSSCGGDAAAGGFPAREQDLLERCMESAEFGPQFAEVARQTYWALLGGVDGSSDGRGSAEEVYIRCAFWAQLLLYGPENVLFPIPC